MHGLINDVINNVVSNVLNVTNVIMLHVTNFDFLVKIIKCISYEPMG